MEWVETTGRTIEEAKDAALDQLGVDEDEAEFEIIEDAKLGLFGRVRSEARVRARVQPKRPRPKEERRDRRRRESRKRSDRPARNGGQNPSSEGPSSEGAVRTAEGGADTRTATRSSGNRPREPVSPADQGARMDVSMSEQGDLAREFLEGLVDAFGVSADVGVEVIDEDTVELRVTGADLGLLIGPKGQTLAAVQELTRTAVQRHTGGGTGRLLVDIAGYRQKRRAALEVFTRQQVERVIDSGARLALEPMSAADRKVVHDTVNDISGVTTTSEGEEPRRRVVILPAGD